LSKITTYPHGWNLIANGLKYGYNSMTFDSSLGYQDIEVVNGGEIETKIVSLVKGNPTHARLQYDGTWATGLSVAKISYYGNQSGL
jgi:hypothetical protein